MEISYEKVRTTKTRVRVLFLVTLLAALLGAGVGFVQQARDVVGHEHESQGRAILANWGTFRVGQVIGVWRVAGGGQMSEASPVVAWAMETQRRLGPERASQLLDGAWQRIGMSSLAGGLLGAFCVLAVGRRKDKKGE